MKSSGDIISVASRWNNKIYNALGDSVTAQNNYQHIVGASLGVKKVNSYGVGGSEIAEKWSGNPDAFCNRYLTMGEADVVTVFGGTNDYGHNVPLGTLGSDDKSTFYGALKVLCEGLLTKYPSGRIVFITPLQRDFQLEGEVSGIGVNKIGITLKQYVNAIKEVCEIYSIPVLDLYSMSGICVYNISNYTIDRLHPNELGMQLISHSITAFLNTV
ncbi:SGNH/GDSL hydrolase family protein [Clostridioides difficile]